MARTKGSVAFPFNFEIGAQSPMDARLVVASKADLIAASTYSAKNYYKGMQVVVADTQEVYILKDVSKITSSDYSGWTRVDGGGSKVTVIDDFTSSSTTAALSARAGKDLNDRISGLGNVYRVKGTKRTIEEVYDISADAKLGDVWNITSAFTIGGKPYPANTNVVCIATSTTPQNNWDPLGGTVNLSTYVPKSDIVDNLSTSDSKKPLSAKQGLALATMITELEDGKETYQLLKTLESGTLSTQSEIDAILGPYSSFNAALNAGKIIHGIYKDDSNRLNTVAFSAFNDTTANRVSMYAILNPSTMVAVLANRNGINWISATIEEGTLGAGITIE